MAELVLKIGPGSGYEDGDIVCAFNDLKIQTKNAENICNPWINGVNEFGTRIVGSISEAFFKRTHLYRFERISKSEIKRINLVDLTEETFGPSHINVPLFIQKRLAEKAPDGGPLLSVFGDPESLVWYGGEIDLSQEKIDLVWNDIEAKTPNLKSDFTLWPLSDLEKKTFLGIKIDKDFSNDISDEYVSSLYDNTNPNNPILVQKRVRMVDWKNDLALSAQEKSDVDSAGVSFDQRDSKEYASTVITEK